MASPYLQIKSAGAFVDITGTPVAAGTLQIQAVDGTNTPIPLRVGSDGSSATQQAVKSLLQRTVTNGAIDGPLSLANPAITNPQNVGYTFTFTDLNTGVVTIYPAVLIQDEGDGSWHIGNLATGQYIKAVPVIVGPPGLNFRGVWQPSTFYAFRDSFSYQGSLYFVQQPQGFGGGVSFTMDPSLTLLLRGGDPVLGARASEALNAVSFGAQPVALDGGITGVNSTASAANEAFIPNEAFTQTGGDLQQITMAISTLGGSHAIDIFVASLDHSSGSGNVFTVIDRFTLAVTGTGILIWYAGLDFTPRVIPSGCWLGFMQTDTLVGYTGGNGHLFFEGSAGVGAVGTSANFSPLRTLASFGFSAVVTPRTALAAAVDVASTAPTGGTAYTQGMALVDGGPSEPALTCWNAMPAERSGYLQRIQMFVKTAGLFTFFFVAPSATVPGGFDRVSSVVLRNVMSTGVVTLIKGVDFGEILVQKGWLLAFRSVTGAVAYTTSNDVARTPLLIYVYRAATLPASGFLPSYPLYTGALSLSFDLIAAEPALTDSTARYRNRHSTELFRESFQGSVLSPEWQAVSGGSWSVSAGLVSPSSGQGANVYLVSSRMYSADKRRTRFRFTFQQAGTVLGFGYTQPPQGFPQGGNGSQYTVSATTLTIQQAWSAGSAPAAQVSMPLGFTVVVGREYLFSVVLNSRVHTVTVTDTVTGQSVSLNDGDNNAPTYPASGMQLDSPAFVAVAGSYKITDLVILADYVTPLVMILGDSNTLGENVTLSTRWAQQLSDALGGNVAISGRNGGVIYDVANRCFTELPALKPRFLIVAIGTNDVALGVTAAQYTAALQTIQTQASRLNIRLILCTVPPAAGHSQAAINAVNSAILALGVPVIRFDKAVTLNNDGISQNTALYQSDGLHYNAAGHAALLARVSIDAPFLYD